MDSGKTEKNMKRRLLLSAVFATFLLATTFLLMCAQPTGHTISTADGLSLTLSADGRVQSLTLNGDELPITPGPALWLRDMSHAGEVTTPNLLGNPGFEQELTGWHVTQQKGIEASVTEDHAHSGSRAMELVGAGGQGLGGIALSTVAPIPVTPGQRYRVSGYFLSSRGYVEGVSGTPPVRQEQMWQGTIRPNGLYVRWRDATGAQLGETTLVAPLHWNAHNWRKISGEVRAPAGAAGMDVIIGGRLRDDTLWVDDLDVVASPETDKPVTGSITPCESAPSNCLRQVATLPGSGLVLTATYTAMTDHIKVHVAVRDTTGADRALEVVWGLPLDLTSGSPDWRWWDDVRHSRTIQSADVASPPPEHQFPAGLSWAYEHVVSGVWDGWLPMSLYPYTVVEDGSHGLALATPLNSPRLVKLAYDQGEKRYEARSYLGISPQAVEVGPTADFSLELYRVDPTWGFRAAMDAFARRHPAWFTPPHKMSGYTNYERGDYTSPAGARHVLENDGKGIFTAEYIVADAPLNVAPSSAPMPSYTQTITLVQSMLHSPSMADRLKAQAITNSVALASNGDWQLKHVGEFEWAQGRWQAVWYTSVDPDIAGGWGPYLWGWDVDRAISATEAISAVLDGVMMDNFLTVPGVDLDPDHLALTNAPLTYDVSTYRPGVHNMTNIDEFFAWLRRQLHRRGRDDMVITINFWGVGTPNALAPWIDAFGGEGDTHGEPTTNWDAHILDYRRAIAYHKPQSWTNGRKDLTTADAKAYVARALFYGIFPTRKQTATGWDAGAEEVLTQAQRLRNTYAPAGWEPLTYARTSNPNVWIERFGDPPTRPKGLYFTIYNPTDITRTTAITIESAPLGLTDPAAATLTDIAITQTIPFTVVGGNIHAILAVPPRWTRIVRVDGGTEAPTPTPTATPSWTQRYLPLLLKRWHRHAKPTATPTVGATATASPTPTSTPTVGVTATASPTPTAEATATASPTPKAATVLIDAALEHSPGPLSPLWRPSIVWQGGGGGGSNINPYLVDFWSEHGGFDRIGLVRIVPELDSIARNEYHLDDYADLVQEVRDHGGRLLVKIRTTPYTYTNTTDPPAACPPNDPTDWRYEHRYAKYGVANDKRVAYGRMIQDFIRYFSAEGEVVSNTVLFGDDTPHETLGMPNVLYELWDEPNYDMLWCDTEEHFLDLYELIVQAADHLRAQDSHVLPFTIGGPGWREQTLRNRYLPAGFGAPKCLPADKPDCGAIRRFYDGLKQRGYLENGHVSWWSYSYLPTELTTGESRTHLDNIRTILHDPRYEGHYDDTLVVVGEWGPPFGNAALDLLPASTWQDEAHRFFGLDINDDNEVGASLVPARLWDMTRASPPPDYQTYFQIGEWPVSEYLPLFKGTAGIFTAQILGLRKAVANVFLMLNRLQPRELSTSYHANPRLNMVATSSEDGRKLAALLWYHPSIKPYETDSTVRYDDLLDSLTRDGIGPVAVTVGFQHLTPGATYTQTVSVVDATHSNAFTYRHAVADDLTAHCGSDPSQWQKACVYQRIGEINNWTLDENGASVALETTTGSLTADDQGRGEITLTANPYSVWLVTLEQRVSQ